MYKDTDDEIWKDIEGLEGFYSVSSKGRVKNINTNRILGDRYDSNGYKHVTLKGKSYKVSRLVALAFLPNPNDLPQVDHIDERKDNNDVSNLRWVTPSENVNHSTHKYSCPVKQLTLDGELIRIWPSFSQIERETGYKATNITQCCKGKYNQRYGFRWEYCDPKSQRIYNRPIAVYKDGEYIGTFANAVKASEALGLKYDSVYHCLRGRFATTKGYTFKYAS